MRGHGHKMESLAIPVSQYPLDCTRAREYTFTGAIVSLNPPENMMEAIYQKAKELADLIYSSGLYRAVRDAEVKVDADEALKVLVERHNALAGKIAEKEKKVQPIEPEEKRELIKIREQMQGNQALQELLKAQTEYAMMMNRVSGILRDKLERKEK